MSINKNVTFQVKRDIISNPLIVSCRESVMEHKTSFYGRFYIGPLELGQGLTLANALRRSLLSELNGLAITSVEIEGVSHEYSTLIGVRESVLDILLNLKQVVLKAKKSLKRPQTAYIYCQGPGVIRAGDMLLPTAIQCVDPEQYIATLSSDGILKMKLIIRQGKNYLVQTSTAGDFNDSLTPLVLSRNNENVRFFSGFQTKYKTKRFQNNTFGDSPLFLSSFKKFVSRSAILNSSLPYKIFLKNLYSKEKLKIGQFGNDKNKTLFLKHKKVCLFEVKNYRSLNTIFENAKNKNWFITLFKKQILYILAIKLYKINLYSSFNANINNLSNSFSVEENKMFQAFPSLGQSSLLSLQAKGNASFDKYNLISNLIKVVKFLENQPGTYCSNFKSFPQLNFYTLFSSLNNKVSYTNSTKPLFIDSVFMPVTKVNYTLEESKQKVFNDIYFNINNQNPPSGSNPPLGQLQHQEDYSRSEDLVFGYNYWSLFCDATSKHPKENFYASLLFNEFNQSPKDIIILEVWTNGSILPRTALKLATKNLTNLLIKFQHAKIMKNSFFENKKTYIKTIQKLYEKYQSPNMN